MWGVLISLPPLKPTSARPKSSARMNTIFGLFRCASDCPCCFTACSFAPRCESVSAGKAAAKVITSSAINATLAISFPPYKKNRGRRRIGDALFTFRPPLLHQRDVAAQRAQVLLAPAFALFEVDGHVAVVHRRRFSLASAVIGLLHPANQPFPQLDERLFVFRIGGEIARLVWVGLYVVQLFFGPRWRKEQFFGERGQLALRVQIAQPLDDLFSVLVGVGLQVRAHRVEVANV